MCLFARGFRAHGCTVLPRQQEPLRSALDFTTDCVPSCRLLESCGACAAEVPEGVQVHPAWIGWLCRIWLPAEVKALVEARRDLIAQLRTSNLIMMVYTVVHDPARRLASSS